MPHVPGTVTRRRPTSGVARRALGWLLAGVAVALPATGPTPSAQAADFNGDGRSDILWRETGNPMRAG